MKKILSLLLVLTIGVTLFTGCSKNDENLQKKSNTTFLTTNIVKPTAKFNTEKLDIYKHIKGNIKEEKIFDQKGISITAKGFDFSTENVKFIFEVENNSKYTYEFDVNDLTINDFMAYAMINEELPSGEKKEIAMTFTDNNLFIKRLETIEDISFTIDIIRISKKQPYKKFTTDTIHLTTGLNETNIIEEKLGQKIIDTEDIKMFYLDMEQNEENIIFYFYTENKKPQEIIITAPKSKAKIGDNTVNISFSQIVGSYKKNIGKLMIKNEELKDIDKLRIKNLTTEFIIYDKKTHSTIFKTGDILIQNLQNTTVN